jgi:outer membrane receptor protein involved in Fe transport
MSSSKGSAIDVLNSASSVTISNDVISIRGNSNILVLIDGIPTTVSDLSAIPAANIKNIDIITNPDASYDAGGTGGIINIVSKKGSTKGFSGVVAANYGFNHFVTSNAAFTFNRPKASYRFTYNTKYEDDVVNTTLDRTLHHSGTKTLQQMQATRYTYNNNIGLGADFRINKKNTLNLDLKCIIPRLNVSQNLQNTFVGTDTERVENRHNDVTWNRENLEATIAYKHIIKPEVSDISIKGSISKIWGHRPSYYFLEGNEVNRSNSGGSPFITALQGDYTNKLKGGTLSTGAKITYRRNDIYHQFYSMENGEWKYLEPLSNDLFHTELVPAAYVMFASKIGTKFSYKAGLRGEFSTVTLSSTHENLQARNNNFFLAPSLSGTYKVSGSDEFAFGFSRRIGRPSYPQLNPYMSMVDATTYEQGNMNLSPEKSSKLDLSYSHSSKSFKLFADLYLNYTAGYISQITKFQDDLLLTTYINAESDLKSGLDLSVTVSPFKWMNATLSANTFYVNTKGSFGGAEIDNRGFSNNSNILFDFAPGKTTDIQLQYFLTTPQYYPQLTTSLTHYMNIGVKQRVLKGAMNISLLLTDVFNTYRWEVHSYNKVFDLTNLSTRKSHMLWFGVTYNINSFKQKKAQTKSEDDRSLIKLGL